MNELFLNENFKLNNKDDFENTIFIKNINNSLYGWDGEFERYKNTCLRGRDHNSLYSALDDNIEFDDMTKEIAVISPETKEIFYSGEDKKILESIKKYFKNYKIKGL